MFRTALFSVLIVMLVLVISISQVFASSLEEPWKEYDLGGETIRISFRFTSATPLGPFGSVFDWYDPNPQVRAHIEEVEEMFNCKIEFVEPREQADVANAVRTGVLAGDTPFDMALIYSNFPGGALVNLAFEGLIMELTDYIEPEYWDGFPPESQRAKEETKIMGRYYSFPARNEPPPGAFAEIAGLIYNRSMLEREGLPDPHEFWDEREWTWEVFKNMARTVTRDTTGDGEIDQWGLWPMHYGNWIASNYGQFYKEVDGRIELTLNEPRIIEAYEFLQELYEEGLVKEGWERRMEEQHAFIDLYPHELSIWHERGFMDDMNDEYGIIGYPMGPQAEDYVSTIHVPTGGNFIPITVEHDPRALIELSSALHKTRAPYLDIEAWQEDFWRRNSMGLRERKSLEIWKWMFYNMRVIPDVIVREVFELMPGIDRRSFVPEIIREGRSPATVLSEMLPTAQSILDEILDQ